MRTDPTVGVMDEVVVIIVVAWRRKRDDANDFPTHPSAIIALFMVYWLMAMYVQASQILAMYVRYVLEVFATT